MFSTKLLVAVTAASLFASSALACPGHKSHDQNAQTPMPKEQQTATQSQPDATAEKQTAEAKQGPAETKAIAAKEVASNPAPTVK